MEGTDLIRQGAELLAKVDCDALSDEELGDELVAIHHAECLIAARRACLTAAFEARRSYAEDGSKTAASWLARRTNGSLAAMRAQTRLARRLRHMPATLAALAAGEISERHAEVLAKLAASERPVVASAFPDAEVELVEHARTLSFEDFVTATRHWESVVDEDGVEDQGAADHDARHVHLSQTFRGNWALDGQLDPLTGEQVATELRRLERQLFEQDWAEAKAEHGDATRLDHLKRTPAQRRADALAWMARRSAAKDPAAGEPRPLLVIHLGDDSLRRLCELASGATIAPGQIIPHLTDADIERIVYAGPSRRVEDLGRKSRFFTGPVRRAIQLRDRRCTHPRCDVTAEDCEVDHVLPVTRDGLTNQDNGTLLCPWHNRRKSDRMPTATDLGPDPPPPADTA